MSSAEEIQGFINKVRELSTRYLMPEQGSKDDMPIMKSEAIYGVECLVSIACMFKAMDTCHKPLVIQAMTSLIFGLDRNKFWKQYSTTLIPVLQMGFNSYIVCIRLQTDQYKTEEKEKLLQQQRRMWLQIFPTAIGCMYGHPKMLDVSHAVLQELEVLI